VSIPINSGFVAFFIKYSIVSPSLRIYPATVNTVKLFDPGFRFTWQLFVVVLHSSFEAESLTMYPVGVTGELFAKSQVIFADNPSETTLIFEALVGFSLSSNDFASSKRYSYSPAIVAVLPQVPSLLREQGPRLPL
jgi:hypothetical protein